ncbi:rod shape-determining protein MreD [Maricaulis sp.]|uniref:rod shape-determining protein MreD n=1 Tax=Maricaulis TaxID=74317 RepID=UPI0025EC93F4|nr:rod shape-determining protein MreD [Maricaulis sp.]MDF1768301.1 rod shape-determining protein MreD [Maricaulis sp.]
MRKPTDRNSPWLAATGCIASVLIALIIQASPTRLVDGLTIMPTWTLMAIFLWANVRPQFMPPIAVFAIGLTQDLLTGAPMGVWALAYLVSISVFRFRGEDGMPRDLPPVLLRFGATLLLAHGIAFAAGSFALEQMADLQPLVIEIVASILMFPLPAYLVLRRRRSRGSGFIGG